VRDDASRVGSEERSHRLKRAKRALRRHVLAGRDALPIAERMAKSEAIAVRLLDTSEAIGARTVMAYWSFGSEVDTSPLIERLLAEGKTVALPRIEQGDLVPVAFVPGEAMHETTFGAMEPSNARALDPRELDLVVVPGVVFDRRCGRIGYGGGFYDRLLGGPSETSSVAVAFDLQLVQEVPRGRSDRTLDAVVTEHEVIRCRR
jgi:5-formyltetrahydrofolate cyclo-ligase